MKTLILLGLSTIFGTGAYLVNDLTVTYAIEMIIGCSPCEPPPQCFPGDPCSDCG